jgi:DNA-binding CsgD family transcriptional regulator
LENTAALRWERYALKISPLPPVIGPFAIFGRCALVRIIPLDRGQTSDAINSLSETFGLTRAEGRLLRAMYETHGTLRHSAENLGISYATARVHLAHILQKTECRGQTELFRMLERLR